MTTGTELWEVHECNKPEHLRKKLKCVRETHCRERKQAQKRERFETTAVVQGVMVEMWEYDHEGYVFVFGHKVSADVQTHE